MTWNFKKSSNNLIIAKNPETGAMSRFKRENANSPWELVEFEGDFIDVDSREFLEVAPRRNRPGAKKKIEDGKAFYIRVPTKIHSELKKCDTYFLRQALENVVKLNGKCIVISTDFSQCSIKDEISYLEEQTKLHCVDSYAYDESTSIFFVNGKAVDKIDRDEAIQIMKDKLMDSEEWEDYTFNDALDAFDLLLDRLNDEFDYEYHEELDRDRVSNISDCLKAIKDFLVYGKEI